MLKREITELAEVGRILFSLGTPPLPPNADKSFSRVEKSVTLGVCAHTHSIVVDVGRARCYASESVSYASSKDSVYTDTLNDSLLIYAQRIRGKHPGARVLMTATDRQTKKKNGLVSMPAH